MNKNYRITTEHAASSYGQPIVEHILTGTAYGDNDWIAQLGCTGGEFKSDPEFWGHENLITPEIETQIREQANTDKAEQTEHLYNIGFPDNSIL